MRKRNLAAWIALAVAASLLVSLAFVSLSSVHVCRHETCGICLTLERCRSLLRGLHMLTLVFLSGSMFSRALAKAESVDWRSHTVTLVSLKVELRN